MPYPTDASLTRFETARLVMRIPSTGDAPALFQAYATDPIVTRYLVWQPHISSAQTAQYLSLCLDAWHTGKERSWVIEERANPSAPIGMIVLRCDSAFRANLGYVLAAPFWGRGYMPEAVQMLLIIGLSTAHLGLFRIEGLCDIENTASARVMEKAGMQREGLRRRYLLHPNVDKEPRDALVYATTR